MTRESGNVPRLIDVLRAASDFLSAQGMDHPRPTAERMLASILGCSRMDLYLAFDRPLSPDERTGLKAMLRRRIRHEPLQYILGETEFMSLPFRVTPDVLIPRPETETLVERVLAELKGRGRVRILDAGSGSGAIGVSLARVLAEASVVCADVDPAAVEVGRENAERNGVADRVRFIKADMTREEFARTVEAPFDAVASNPPYVSEGEWPFLPPEVRDYEPRLALFGGEDGLDFHRALIRQGPAILPPGGLLLLEVGAGQAQRVSDMLGRSGFTDIATADDLNGIPRVVRGMRLSSGSSSDTG